MSSPRRRFLAPEVVQTSSMDCGPAALACLLGGFGIRASYGRLREACQTDVDGTSISNIELDLCGGTFTFPGPLNLPPNRSLTFFMLLVDPNIYGSGNGTPAQFVIYDDGAPATALTSGDSEGQTSILTSGFGTKASAR